MTRRGPTEVIAYDHPTETDSLAYFQLLAFPGHGEASVSLHQNLEGLGQEASAVVTANRIADLDNLLGREESTEVSERWVVDVAAICHLFDVAEHGALPVIEERRAPPIRDLRNLLVTVAAQSQMPLAPDALANFGA